MRHGSTRWVHGALALVWKIDVEEEIALVNRAVYDVRVVGFAILSGKLTWRRDTCDEHSSEDRRAPSSQFAMYIHLDLDPPGMRLRTRSKCTMLLYSNATFDRYSPD